MYDMLLKLKFIVDYFLHIINCVVLFFFVVNCDILCDECVFIRDYNCLKGCFVLIYYYNLVN